jgi:two-component system, LytTR family, response regulator
MIRAVIIDDEQAGIETLNVFVSRHAEKIRVVAAALNPGKGIQLIEDYKPDVVFLDVNMPTMNGFELLDKLSHRDFKLVFTTAHRDYAIDAIKHKAFDYLLKPISGADFSACLENLLREHKQVEGTAKQPAQSMLELQVKDGIVFIKQKDIIRLQAARSYTEIFLDNGVKHVASRSLSEYETKLDPVLFFRIHKSHVVNLAKVQKFVNHQGFFVRMSDGSLPDVAKSHKDVLLERLKTI